MADEERYMAKYGLPGDHAAAHRMVKEKTDQLYSRYKPDNDEFCYEILQFLKAWWVGHIPEPFWMMPNVRRRNSDRWNTHY